MNDKDICVTKMYGSVSIRVEPSKTSTRKYSVLLNKDQRFAIDEAFKNDESMQAIIDSLGFSKDKCVEVIDDRSHSLEIKFIAMDENLKTETLLVRAQKTADLMLDYAIHEKKSLNTRKANVAARVAAEALPILKNAIAYVQDVEAQTQQIGEQRLTDKLKSAITALKYSETILQYKISEEGKPL